MTPATWYRAPKGLVLKRIGSAGFDDVRVCPPCHQGASFRATLCRQGVLTLTCDTCGSVVVEITATGPSGEPWFAEPTRATIQ